MGALRQISNQPKTLAIETKFGRSSNGFLEYIFRRAAHDLYQVSISPETPLVYKQGKNKHYQEVTYPGVPLKFVQAYGFQHIQNIIRKLKTAKCDYEYVELMACPSGCLNGGGQVPAQGDKAEHLAKVSAHSDRLDIRSPPSFEVDAFLAKVGQEFPGWSTTTFHPIDDSDPMV